MNEVNLYINGYEVDLSEDFKLNMTYTVEKTTNPTAVKNNYSKTITLPSTANNNKIFNNLWNPSSIYNQYFDLIKKSDFKLYYNGDLFEEGYIKVDNIIKNGGQTEYKCTLYGGLGDFFYSLSVDKEGNKMKLSDLDYGGGNYEFDIMVNKDVIYDAWSRLCSDTTEGTIYDDINFAVCHNGIPDNFSSDRVLINRFEEGPYNLPFHFYSEDDEIEYKHINGWVLGELKQEYDEWGARDLRSYLQRPTFRVKTLFRGICDPKNNGGYTVNLDSTFFNSNNPYYEKAWITLPLISEMDEVTTVKTGVDINFDDIISFERDEIKDVEIHPSVTAEEDVSVLSVEFQLTTQANLTSPNLYTGLSYTLNRKLMYYNAPIAVQLVGRKKNTSDVVYASGIEVFSSYTDINDSEYLGKKLGLNKINYGNFFKVDDTDEYVWGFNNQPIVVEFTIRGIDDINAYDWSFILSRYEIKSEQFTYYNGNARFLDCVFIGFNSEENGNLTYSGVYEYNYFPYKAYSTSFKLEKYDQPISEINKRKLTKSRLLGKDGTPLEYLLGYTKQFGLCFIKDFSKKIIHIMTRKTFYGKRNVIDLEELIDRGNTITITPLNFEKKWYDMGLEIEENKYSKLYNKIADIPFGTKRVDTGYEYVKDKEDLLKDNIYKSGLMVREKSPYLVNFRLPK